MKKANKNFISIISIICILLSLGTTVFGITPNDVSNITSDSEYHLTPDEIMNGNHFSKEVIEDELEDGKIILGGFDAPVSALESSKSRVITG